MPETIDMRLPDGARVPCFLTAPLDDHGPGLLVVPSIFGTNEDVVDQARELAHAGAVVVVVDPFFRSAPGVLRYDEVEAARSRAKYFDFNRGVADFSSMLRTLGVHPNCNGKVGILGICFGGRYAWMAASRGEVDFMATWHGSAVDDLANRGKSIRCPVSLHYGDEDTLVPEEAIEKVRAVVGKRPDVELRVWPGAHHGFTQRSHPTAFHPEAEAGAMASLRRLISQFRHDDGG